MNSSLLREKGESEPLVTVEHLTVRFGHKGRPFSRAKAKTAVDDISFDIRNGETFAIVGESGSGKTTTGRAILQLVAAEGSVQLRGKELIGLSQRQLRPIRRGMQMIFQDPYGSLNPKLTVGEIVAEPLVSHGIASGAELQERIAEILKAVGLSPDYRSKLPKEFSGGQRQRINIARALALNPEFIVADEPTSALDVSIQAQIANLLMDLQGQFGLTYLFISHDLGLVRQLCDRIGVMFSGHIVEIASREEFFSRPLHPYSSFLLGTVPSMDPRVERARLRRFVSGAALERDERSSTETLQDGCPFASRCGFVIPSCRAERPPLIRVSPSRSVACLRWDEISFEDFPAIDSKELSDG